LPSYEPPPLDGLNVLNLAFTMSWHSDSQSANEDRKISP
jgi:hypothetical protein